MKPIAALCIAPVLLARVLGDEHISHEITIGTDKEVAQALQMMGSTHKECAANRLVVDTRNSLITTPAYMLATSISEVAEGIENAIERFMDILEEPPQSQW